MARTPPIPAELAATPTGQVLLRVWERLTDVLDRVATIEGEVDPLLRVRQVATVTTRLARNQAQLQFLTPAPVFLSPSDPSLPLPDDDTPVPPPAPPPAPQPTPQPKPPAPPGAVERPPSQLSVIQAVDAANPGLIDQSCLGQGGNWEFLDAVVAELRRDSPRWGYNCKRGNCTEISEDIVDYYYGLDLSQAQNSTQVYIFDIIVGHCGPNPQPAWIDQTQATADAGTIGRWRFPRP